MRLKLNSGSRSAAHRGPIGSPSTPTYLLNGIWGEISPDGTKIAYSRFDPDAAGADGWGTFNAYVADIDGGNEVCISSAFLTTHCGMASWHPSGDWLVISREMTVGYNGLHFNAHPGKGIFVNLWAVRPDGSDWTQLTSYATTRDGDPMHSPIGALQARFSHDGTKLAWSRKIGSDVALPFAYWDVVYANFSLPGDVPTIGTQTDITPTAGGTFFEVWDWSDDDTEIVIAADSYSVAAYLNVHLLNVSTKAITQVTGPNIDWDEQSFLSPDGSRIAITTTRNQIIPYDPNDYPGSLNQDVWIADAGLYGTRAQQLTFFNDPASPMYFDRVEGGAVRATANQWHPNGTILINAVQNLGSEQYHELAELWLLTGQTGAFVGNSTEVVLNPSADTMNVSLTTTTNYGTNALIAFGDSSAGGSGAYRILVKFDLSGIPEGARIISATLSLNEYLAYDTASVGSWSANVFRLLRNWVETQATWNVYSTGNSWSVAGGGGVNLDIVGTASATLTLDGTALLSFVHWTGDGLRDDVQNMVDGVVPNYGWLLAAPTAEYKGVAPMAANLFRSNNYSVVGDRPRLTVVYVFGDGLLSVGPASVGVLGIDSAASPAGSIL